MDKLCWWSSCPRSVVEWNVFKTCIVTTFDTLFHRFFGWGFGRNTHAVGMWINRVEGVSNQGDCRSYPVALCIKKRLWIILFWWEIIFFQERYFIFQCFVLLYLSEFNKMNQFYLTGHILSLYNVNGLSKQWNITYLKDSLSGGVKINEKNIPT